MKKKHERNGLPLGSDPGFNVEEAKAADSSQATDVLPEEEMQGETSFSYQVEKRPLFFLLLLFLCVLIPGIVRERSMIKKIYTPVTEASDEIVRITEVEKEEETSMQQGLISSGEETKETMQEAEEGSAEDTADLSWQSEVFGDYSKSVVTYPISIQGLTENERNLTNFRESDFVKSLSSFLTMNNVKTSALTFTGSVACSAPQAAAYTAQMKGIKDRSLVVLFFPGYPGKYLFTLEETKADDPAEEKSTEEKKETPALTPPQSTAAQAAPLSAPAQAEPETEAPYDAMRLKLTGISEELDNYLANSYELQYSLYDYLYKRGIKNAARAAIKFYFIDSEDRSASILIEITGVGSVTAIYDLDNNEYSFR